jgi:hypothetical protein
MVAGDWNGDGLADIAGGTNTLLFAYSVGGGNFGPPQAYPNCCEGYPFDVAAGDFDHDGRDDVAMGGPELVYTFRSNDSGGFDLPDVHPMAARDLAVGDVDGNGELDIVGVGWQQHFGYLPGFGNATFGAPRRVGTGGSAQLVRVDDLNLDGSLDVALATQPGGDSEIETFLGAGSGLFTGPTTFAIGYNGIRDLATASFSGVGPSLLIWHDQALSVMEPGMTAALGPAAAASCPGGPLVVEAVASGFGPLSYQWRKGGVPLADGGSISGATTPTLQIDPVTAGDTGSYDLVVTDLCGSASTAPVAVSVLTALPPPTLFAAVTVPPGTPGLNASVAPQGGHSYAWDLQGGQITAGQGTSQITFTSGGPGVTMELRVDDQVANCTTSSATREIQVVFSDVSPTSPYFPFIHTIARNGVTSGCGGGNFCPDDFVTRAQMAVFLLISKNGEGYTPPPATGLVFLDVPVSAFAAAFIEALAAAGVTSGCGGNNYCPNGFVTRAQMAVFLLRMLEGAAYSPPPATGTVFLDVGVLDFAAAYIEELAERGISSGCGGGNYCPNDLVTRAQMSVFLTTTFDLQ